MKQSRKNITIHVFSFYSFLTIFTVLQISSAILLGLVKKIGMLFVNCVRKLLFKQSENVKHYKVYLFWLILRVRVTLKIWGNWFSTRVCYLLLVQVFAKDVHGRVTWKDSPNWRDRSGLFTRRNVNVIYLSSVFSCNSLLDSCFAVVPTPQAGDVEAYKKRAESKKRNFFYYK